MVGHRQGIPGTGSSRRSGGTINSLTLKVSGGATGLMVVS